MGQVYQATDTKLNRQVALKILPEAFATDPDRLARFQREAQVLASLNHPGIAAIYGIEESGDTRALVLELVEGPTLADRIAKGPIPLDEALPIAKQIAEALEAAHEAGVIHRDLKPANIKVREDGTVKVLDFGLAKALDTTPQGDPSLSPTLTAAATQMGVIMGTAGYMSPEQARGKPADKRTDIWAFGCVLYEMLTGQRAFQGEDVSLTLAPVMKSDVDVRTLSPDVPANLRTVLRRCLEKDPRERLRDIGDVRLAMEGAFETVATLPNSPSGTTSAGWRPALLLALGTLVVGTVVGGLGVWSAARPSASPVTRFSIHIDTAPRTSDTGIALSPDGRTLVYSLLQDGGVQLYQRRMAQLEAQPVRGAEGANGPFFSPDGASVGFHRPTEGMLERVPLSGGSATALSAVTGFRGATWGPNGAIAFTGVGEHGGLWLVAEAGGTPEQIGQLRFGARNYAAPTFVPDGSAVLFTVMFGPTRPSQVAVLSLNTGEQKILLTAVRHACCRRHTSCLHERIHCGSYRLI